MKPKHHTIKINLPGGIIASGDLYALMTAAEKAGIEQIQLGNRQQLFCKVESEKLPLLKNELSNKSLTCETDAEEYPNIVSSYVTEEVFQHAHWLGESLYKDILSLFEYQPRLKINLCDAHQSFIPFFTGHINFISSPVPNYWYLYFRFPKTSVRYCWKGLIYSYDIPRISRHIGEIYFAHRSQFYTQLPISGDILYNKVHAAASFITQPVNETVKLPDFALPYYEGFNRYNDKNWLGIYRRDEKFPVPLLKEIAGLCLDNKIGQLYTTPWKTLIIKGIALSERKKWEYVLGKYRINVHHAANELNWQVEDLNEEGLNLKRYLIRQLDKEDIRTYGLCFAVRSNPGSELFGAVIIRKQPNRSRNQYKAMDRYEILYAKDFNPNSGEYILFRNDVKKESLPVFLVSLCKYYYELQRDENEIKHSIYRQEETATPVIAEPLQQHPVYQCLHCLTVYDEAYGDDNAEIPAGTKFEELPEPYRCSTCNAAKEEFTMINSLPVAL